MTARRRGRASGRRRGKRRRRRRARGARSGALTVSLAALLCAGAFVVQARGPALVRSLASLEVGLPSWLDPGERLRVAQLSWRHVDFVGLHKLAPRDLLPAIVPSQPVALLDVDPDVLCERLGRHPRVSSCRGVREALGQGLLRAQTLDTYTEKAWAMRDAFDGLLTVIVQRIQE